MCFYYGMGKQMAVREIGSGRNQHVGTLQMDGETMGPIVLEIMRTGINYQFNLRPVAERGARHLQKEGLQCEFDMPCTIENIAIRNAEEATRAAVTVRNNLHEKYGVDFNVREIGESLITNLTAARGQG